MLTVDVRYLALSVPGSALPTDLLTGCSLPTVPDMVFDSLHGQRLFKDQRDHAHQAAGGCCLAPWAGRTSEDKSSPVRAHVARVQEGPGGLLHPLRSHMLHVEYWGRIGFFALHSSPAQCDTKHG